VTIPADARRGRAFVCGVIIVNTLGLLSAITLAAATEDHGRLLRHLFSLLVNSGLMYGLWRGIRWVKWLFAFGMLLSGLLLLYFPVRFPGSAFTLITVPFAVLLLWASWHLAFAPTVNLFFQFQRGEAIADLQATAPCPKCGRVNSVHTHVCPRCETRL